LINLNIKGGIKRTDLSVKIKGEPGAPGSVGWGKRKLFVDEI